MPISVFSRYQDGRNSRAEVYILLQFFDVRRQAVSYQLRSLGHVAAVV